MVVGTPHLRLTTCVMLCWISDTLIATVHAYISREGALAESASCDCESGRTASALVGTCLEHTPTSRHQGGAYLGRSGHLAHKR
ncbi:hypothetical protein F5Y08DRAFT_323107 [Xylaria arbuscula]|nr:hypothetical protein F5Y08DRAFT_323107 [Xylaria arbuscula]